MTTSFETVPTDLAEDTKEFKLKRGEAVRLGRDIYRLEKEEVQIDFLTINGKSVTFTHVTQESDQHSWILRIPNFRTFRLIEHHKSKCIRFVLMKSVSPVAVS